MAMINTVDEYVMGRTSEEYQRLRRQAQIWERGTRQLFQRVGLTSGMSCLEIGCGPGESMRLMGEFVGASGSILGLDIDSKIGHEALGMLKTAGPSHFTFREADAETIPEIPEGPFDLTYTRLTLVHAKDPIALLQRMYEWTKPGGYVVAQEYYLRTYSVYPDWSGISEFEKVLYGVFQKAGKDLNLGHKLPQFFVDAGIGYPDGSDVACELLRFPKRESESMMRAAYASVLPIALKLGITSEADSQGFFRDVSIAASEQRHTILSPLLIGVWKRKAS